MSATDTGTSFSQATSAPRGSIRLASAAGILGGLVFGFTSGVIAAAQLGVETQFHTTALGVTLVTCSLLVGALIGAVMTNRLYEPIGPRATLMIAAVLVIVGSIASALVGTDMLWALALARLIAGLGVGIASVASPQFLGEMVPSRVRGTLIGAYQLLIVVGILLAYLVGMVFTGSPDGWRAMFLAAVVPGVALFFVARAAADSPKFLLSRGDAQAARATLLAIEPELNPDTEVAALQAEHDAPTSTMADLLRPSARPALTIALVLAVTQIITGINAIMYFAPQIFKLTGFGSDSSAVVATVAVGVVNVIATAAAVRCVDKFGRRPLLITGTSIMIVSSFVLAGVLIAGASGGIVGIISLICVFGFVIGFALSLGPIVWILIAEVFPADLRSRGISLAIALNWASNVVLSLIFLLMLGALGAGWSFAIFGAVTVLTLLFIVKKVPETKGRTLKQISDELAASAS